MSFYQNLIGVLIWIIQVGRIDNAFEVSYLLRYLAFPSNGHLVQSLYALKSTEINNANDLAFDSCYQRVTSDQYIQGRFQAMRDLYADVREDIPPNYPKPSEKLIQVNFLSIMIMQEIEQLGNL